MNGSANKTQDLTSSSYGSKTQDLSSYSSSKTQDLGSSSVSSFSKDVAVSSSSYSSTAAFRNVSSLTSKLNVVLWQVKWREYSKFLQNKIGLSKGLSRKIFWCLFGHICMYE